MAKIVVATQTFADIRRGDVVAVHDDSEDEGSEVRRLPMFRVVKVPGTKAEHAGLMQISPTEKDKPDPKQYFMKSIDIDTIEALEIGRKGRALLAADECVLATKESAATLAATKASKDVFVDVVEELPPVEKL